MTRDDVQTLAREIVIHKIVNDRLISEDSAVFIDTEVRKIAILAAKSLKRLEDAMAEQGTKFANDLDQILGI